VAANLSVQRAQADQRGRDANLRRPGIYQAFIDILPLSWP